MAQWLTNVQLENGNNLDTGKTAGNTVSLRAYDTDGASYTTFVTLTANTTPTMTLSSNVTGVTQSANDNSTKLATTAYVDSIADANTWRPVTAGGNSLSSAETLAFTAGTNVTITEAAGAVTINSTDQYTGTVTGTSVDNRVAYWNGTTAIQGSANFTFDDTHLSLAATSRMYFDGGGDTYIYEQAANVLDLLAGNAVKIRIDHGNTLTTIYDSVAGSNGSGWRMPNTAATSTAPTLIPNKTNLTYGIGGTTNEISVIANGIEAITAISTGKVFFPVTPTTGTTENILVYGAGGELRTITQASLGIGGGTVGGTGTNNQVAIWNGTTDIDALAAGSVTEVLTMVGGIPAWADPIDSVLKRVSLRTADTTTDLAIVTGVAVSWNGTEDYKDSDVFTHSTVTNPSRLTVLEDGVYTFNATIGYDTDQTSNRTIIRVYFRVNGSTVYQAAAGRSYHRGTTYGNATSNIVQDISLSANDYIEVMAAGDTTSNYVANMQVAYCDFSARLATSTAVGNTWRPVADMGDLGNVTITSIASGELLTWNGSIFINETLAQAGISATTHNHTGVYLQDSAGTINGVTLTDNGTTVTLGGAVSGLATSAITTGTFSNSFLASVNGTVTNGTHSGTNTGDNPGLTSTTGTISGISLTDNGTLITLGGQIVAATTTVRGGIELEDANVQTTAANAVTTTASRTYGLQVNSGAQGVINVPWVNTTYSAATATVAGLIELEDNAVQTTAANAITTTASRTYGLQVNSSGQGVINVPWTDTGTDLDDFYSATQIQISSSTGDNAFINSFSQSLAGCVPSSGGGTTNFLRADGTWAAAGSTITIGDTQVAYALTANNLGGTSAFTYNDSTNALSVVDLIVSTTSTFEKDGSDNVLNLQTDKGFRVENSTASIGNAVMSIASGFNKNIALTQQQTGAYQAWVETNNLSTTADSFLAAASTGTGDAFVQFRSAGQTKSFALGIDGGTGNMELNYAAATGFGTAARMSVGTNYLTISSAGEFTFNSNVGGAAGAGTYLDKDGGWTTPAGSGGTVTGTGSSDQVAVWSGSSVIGGSSGLTWSGTELITNAVGSTVSHTFESNIASASTGLMNLVASWNGTQVAAVRGLTGTDTGNKDDGELRFYTSTANNLTERLRITSAGQLDIAVQPTTGNHSDRILMWDSAGVKSVAGSALDDINIGSNTSSDTQVYPVFVPSNATGRHSTIIDGGIVYDAADNKLYSSNVDQSTYLGQDGNIALDSVTNTAAEWAALPLGYCRMMNSSIGTGGGLPVANHGYFLKTANRDTGGGYSGFMIGYSANENYIGRSSTNASFLTWEKIAMHGTTITATLTGTSSQSIVNNSTSATWYPIVWHNNSNTLYDTNASLLVQGSTGSIRANQYYIAGTTHGLDAITGTYGSFNVVGTTGGYYGVNLNGRAVFMHNGTTTSGLYNDVDNKWILYGAHNSTTHIHYNGISKIQSTTNGCTVVGSGTATDWIATSDRRLKENIRYNESWKDRVLKIGKLTARYDWIDKEEEHPYDNIGFIAQDIQPIANEFVDSYTRIIFEGVEEDGVTDITKDKEYFTLNYNKMIAPLYSAFLEKHEEDTLNMVQKDNEILELRTELDELKKLVNTLIEDRK